MTDRAGSEPVAIVSVSEARRDLGGLNPLGRRIRHQSVWRRIVGVAADVKFRGLAKEDEPTIYVPAAQYGLGWPKFIVRGSAAAAIEPAFRSMLRELEPRASLVETATLPALIEKSYAGESALIAGRLVRPYLFGVRRTDPVSFVAVGAGLVVVTAAASLIPAHGAGKTSPAVVLRAE